MKPVVIDITELSDSREVYDSKPHPFVTVFIYLILALITIAFIWMYIGELDIVVKAQGIVRPNEKISTVKNTFDGEVIEVNYKDGQVVNKGDILYKIDHTQLLTDKMTIEEQLKEANEQLEMMEKYKLSLDENKNHFNEKDKEEYALKYKQFELDYKMLIHNYNLEDKQILAEQNDIEKQLRDLEQNISLNKQLKQSIEQGKLLIPNTSKESQMYVNKFTKYNTDVKVLEQQYNKQEMEINSTNNEELTKFSLENLENQLKNYNKLQECIENNRTTFSGDEIFRIQLEQYNTKVSELEDTYIQAKDIYEINKELEGIGVTKQDVKDAESAKERADNAITEYQNNYIVNIQLTIENIEKR